MQTHWMENWEMSKQAESFDFPDYACPGTYQAIETMQNDLDRTRSSQTIPRLLWQFNRAINYGKFCLIMMN